MPDRIILDLDRFGVDTPRLCHGFPLPPGGSYFRLTDGFPVG